MQIPYAVATGIVINEWEVDYKRNEVIAFRRNLRRVLFFNSIPMSISKSRSK